MADQDQEVFVVIAGPNGPFTIIVNGKPDDHGDRGMSVTGGQSGKYRTVLTVPAKALLCWGAVDALVGGRASLPKITGSDE